MLIGEVSKHSGVSARMLRHYDSVGLVSSTGRFQSGYRQYSAEDVRRLFHVEAGTRSGRRAAVASGRVVTNRLSRRRPSSLVVTAPGTELRGVDSRLGRGSILLVGCGGSRSPMESSRANGERATQPIVASRPTPPTTSPVLVPSSSRASPPAAAPMAIAP